VAADKSDLLLAMEAKRLSKLAKLPPDQDKAQQAIASLVDFFAAKWLQIGLKEAACGLALLCPIAVESQPS